ncbi:LEM domain-containing protein 1 isoform X2 [Pleurodeles waltl]|uniref:LEM domain-containing protein 1 isoform X2 n=1 Tax=Pleurodeles waltl TaxID=8319 RepID=UPI003709665F
MPLYLEDPAHFTKEKLRDQLIAHHVPLPEGDQKKDVYLQMYLKYVPLKQRAIDFSSDEDEDEISCATVKSQRENKKIISKMDVQNLSDAELKDQLIKHGAMPGPILPTTRCVYEKKLKQLLDQGPPVPQTRQNGNGDMEQYSDSEEEDPRERRAQQARETTLADVSNSSIFNHSKTPFSPPSEASKSNTAFDSSFSVTRMVEQMDQRPSVCHAGGLQKTPGSGIRSSYCAKDALMVDKNTMTYRTPTNTPKACVFARQIRLQADDFLQKDDLAGRYVPSTPNPLGLSATRRKPIKGAAGRPIQFKYDDILTQAKLVEQAKAQTTKVLPGKAVPLYVHVALFAFVAFLALVFFTMEHNPENPFHAFVEKVEVHQPQ